jgi:uncharacterized glyoxalase superfamily protein PhnB
MTKIVNDARGKSDRVFLIPTLTVRDTKKSIHFFEKVFGFTLKETHEDNGEILHAELHYHDCLMLAKEGAFGSPLKAPKESLPLTLYVYVDNVDAATKKVSDYGGKVISEPADAFWGDRYAEICDVDGYTWLMGTEQVYFNKHHG